MQIGATAADTTAIVAALKNAAAATGSDFHYLLGTAMRESSLKPNAQSSTSSAAGLFQFLDQTWFGLIKTHGAKYGLSSMADAITLGPDGRYHIADSNDRQAILALKKDPKIAALMAGEYARSSEGAMEANLGRSVCGGELYAAHFLGADAACKLIRLCQSAPATSAAELFPQAANANRNVFFHTDGSAKSVREVYDWAMRQPGGEAQPMGDIPGSATVVASHALDANVQTLLAGVANWQPSGFFATTKMEPLSFGSGLLDIFSSARNGI